MSEPLFPALVEGSDREAITIGGEALTFAELGRAAGGLAGRLSGIDRAAIYATTSMDTVIAFLGAIAAGTMAISISPDSGVREIEHMLGDSAPGAVIAQDGDDLPEQLAALPRISPRGPGATYREHASGTDTVAIVVYTSGTTGLAKGVQIPRRAIATNLDALGDIWEWTAADRLVHGLPLFHVHGLVLGIFGPLRLGGQVEHIGRFDAEAIARAFARGATMSFGVPTMYSRLADAAERSPAVADALRGARLLVSGSAPLPATVHKRIEALTGQRIVERYGMTETIMNTAVRADGERLPGYVGPPVPGVEVNLLDDDGNVVAVSDDETFGEIAVRGPNLFTGYLNRPDATAESMRDGWFLTGDLATRAANGYIRIVGRRSTDLIKSGGYKIGASEIETVLLEHPAVAEVAVKGLPDEDLGERPVAWVVCREGRHASADELIAHTGTFLSSHKRPREVRFVAELPRNSMGKVVKSRLS